MNTCRTIGAIVMLAIVFIRNGVAQDIPRFSPSRPTTSPYLNLLPGGAGNYFGLVRPQANQRAFDNRISNAARSQDLAIQRLSDVSGVRSTGPTGTGSVFNNRSHFYPSKQSSSRRR